MPKALLVLAATLFVASVLGTLAALGVFFYYGVGFWYIFRARAHPEGGSGDPSARSGHILGDG